MNNHGAVWKCELFWTLYPALSLHLVSSSKYNDPPCSTNTTRIMKDKDHFYTSTVQTLINVLKHLNSNRHAKHNTYMLNDMYIRYTILHFLEISCARN